MVDMNELDFEPEIDEIDTGDDFDEISQLIDMQNTDYVFDAMDENGF